MSQSPKAGVNDLYAAHGNLGRAITGQSLGEGEVLVIAPHDGGQFDIVGTLTLATLQNFGRALRNFFPALTPNATLCSGSLDGPSLPTSALTRSSRACLRPAGHSEPSCGAK